ncbi:uncharacterized protein LOC101893542 [Musca domestica]|uniref:Proton myo-inositol cotransporter n=1 Tax=Musca domestica TaxID=7370 RepID=A0A1I8N866_MUSDO|nr:uncharacterized protein LOC101893542 [Musca domestica]
MIEHTERRGKSRPQIYATIPGGVIFFSAGMNLAISVGWAKFGMMGTTKHFCNSWLIGVIAGTILSTMLRKFLSKKVLWIISSVLIFTCGLIFTAVPDTYDALLAGRYLSGIGVGLAIVSFIMHASEIAVKKHRGRCLVVEQFSMSLGIAVQMIYTSNWNAEWEFSTYRMHGILEIVLAFLGVAALILFIESPIDQIRWGNDHAALTCYSKLRLIDHHSKEAYDLLSLGKVYVSEEESLSFVENLKRGLLPLVKMLMFRSVVVALCFSLPFSAAFQYSSEKNDTEWVATVAACGRLLGAICVIYLVDSVGRKTTSLLTMFIAGGMLIGLGPLFSSLSSTEDTSNMATATYLCTCMQFAVGYFTPFTSVYLGEAFPLLMKPYFIALCVIAEQLVHIVLISTISVDLSLMDHGIIIAVIFFISCFTMPETKNTTLQEAQRRFRRWFNIGKNY